MSERAFDPQDYQERLCKKLGLRGIPDEFARTVSVVAIELLCEDFNGRGNVYFPKGYRKGRNRDRDRRIYAAFNGANILDLAKEYDLCPRRIEQILAEQLHAKRGGQNGPVASTSDVGSRSASS